MTTTTETRKNTVTIPARDLVADMYVGRDGADWVVVETGRPEDPVRVGVGPTLRAAYASLERTPLQSDGAHPVMRALEWASGQGWIASAADEVTDEDDAKLLEDVEIEILGADVDYVEILEEFDHPIRATVIVRTSAGDVWVDAGVPERLVDEARAVAAGSGGRDVYSLARYAEVAPMEGAALSDWCPADLQAADPDDVIAAVRRAALSAWRRA